MTTLHKGKLAEALVLAEAVRRGYTVSVPFQEGCPYDLILDDGERLLRVQVKYTTSDGEVVKVSCRSCNGWQNKSYCAKDVDAILCVDATTGLQLYLEPELFDKQVVSFRVTPPANGQVKGIRYAEDFVW